MCWIPTEFSSCSLISTTLLMHATSDNLHLKSVPSLQLVFTSLFRPYLFIKSFLQFSLNSLLLYLSNLSPPYFCLQPSLQSTSKVIFLPHIYPIQIVSRDQLAREFCEDWLLFNFCVLPQSIDRDKRTHNHWFRMS